MTTPPPRDPFTPYAGPGWRQRLRVAALAAVVALGILWLLVETPGGVRRAPPVPPASAASAASVTSPSPPDVPACTPGQTQGCVGSMSTVINPRGR